MKTIKIILLVLLSFSAISIGLAQQSNNNAFLFNGESSLLYVYDGQPANTNAKQNGFGFFNSSSSKNKITVQAWIYLLGDTPVDVEYPVIYRKVNNGTTFSLYVKNNRAYFSVGNNNSQTVSTPEFPAFGWIAITGSYDGANLKIYLGGSLVSSVPFNMTPGYSITNGETGLFVGKSETGAFKGLIDEIRIFNTALGHNNINGSGGNGIPAEPFPSSIAQYLAGQWSFTEISTGNLLKDLSSNKNNLFVNNIDHVFPSKKLPFFVVKSVADELDAVLGDGSAVSLNGEVTLRSAIQESNALSGSQLIYFYIQGVPPVIQPTSALPHITDPVFIDATIQNGYSGSPVVQLNGNFGNLTITGSGTTLQGIQINNPSGYGVILSGSGNTIIKNQISGLKINSPGNSISENLFTNSVAAGVEISDGAVNTNFFNNTISGNETGIEFNVSGFSLTSENIITANTGNGIIVNGSNNKISNQKIFNNGSSGIFIQSGTNNSLLNNSVYSNNSLGIQLAAGTNDSQVYPTLNTLYTWQDETALPEIKGGTSIQGTLSSAPNENFKIQFFANSNTVNREGKTFLGEINVTTDIAGSVDFLANLKDIVLPDGEVVSATATKLDNTGNTLSTSEFSESISRETDEGLHYLVNTTLAGIPLHWKNGKGNYQIAQSVVNLGYDDEIESGFNTWNALNQIGRASCRERV